MPWCTVKKVSSFQYKGKTYQPGDKVNVPKRYQTLDFLEPIPEKKSAPKKSKKTKKESE